MLALAEALLAQLLHQLLELILQRLLALAQVAHLLVALLTLLSLLTLLAALPALAIAALVLALLEGAVAQLLLLANHVAELVELRHHVVVAVTLHLLAGTRHLQVLQHRLQILQHLARGILGARARHLLKLVDHVAQILRAQLTRIGIERARELLRILAHLLGHRLQELVERRPQVVGELLDLLVAGTALERLTQRFLRRAQLLLRIGDAAVLEMHGHVPHARDHVAQLIIALGARELPVDRAQAEIDVALHVEALGRERERIERVEHGGLRIGVQSQDAALLDQRARHRLHERALRQAELERRARALVAGLVARGQRHGDIGAGPGMLGEVLGGLAHAGLGARLGQPQREVRRIIERTRRLPVGARARLAPEGGLRTDDAVIVLELVVELQRTARLAFRILGKRDRRRLVRNGSEVPAHVAGAGAAHGCNAAVVDDETALLGGLVDAAGIGARLRARRRIGKAARGRHVERNAGGADHQGAAGRHRDRCRGLHRLARPQSLQDQRRPPRIGRRADPGVDTEIGRHHHALPIEGGNDTLRALAARGHERRHHQHRDQGPQGHWVAHGEAGHRRAGLERLGGAQRTFHVGAPQRGGEAVGTGRGDVVRHRGRGPMRQAGIAIEPLERIGLGREADPQQRRERRGGEQEEDAEPDRASGRRQPEPQPEPGHREEQSDDGGD